VEKEIAIDGAVVVVKNIVKDGAVVVVKEIGKDGAISGVKEILIDGAAVIIKEITKNGAEVLIKNFAIKGLFLSGLGALTMLAPFAGIFFTIEMILDIFHGLIEIWRYNHPMASSL
jgi:hypothetical protein